MTGSEEHPPQHRRHTVPVERQLQKEEVAADHGLRDVVQNFVLAFGLQQVEQRQDPHLQAASIWKHYDPLAEQLQGLLQHQAVGVLLEDGPDGTGDRLCVHQVQDYGQRLALF